MKNTKQEVLNVAEDLIGNFLYYDRKPGNSGSDLQINDIEDMIIKNIVSIRDITEHFRVIIAKCVEERRKELDKYVK